MINKEFHLTIWSFLETSINTAGTDPQINQGAGLGFRLGVSYHTAQNFGKRKLWQIWQTISNLPKVYLPNVVSSYSELLLV